MLDIPPWLQVALLVVGAFFLGRWTARARGREPQRYRPPAQPVSRPELVGDRYNAGAGIDASQGGGGHPIDMALEAELKSLLHANRKIDAIKLARVRLDIGLKEAKDLVEAL
jgi:hypothetical protein